MQDLTSRLEQLGSINQGILKAVKNEGPQCAELLVLRADFSFECNQLLNQLTASLNEHQHGRLASRLLGEFISMHQMLSLHQQKWPPFEIARDPESYLTRSQTINAAVIKFIETAIRSISEAFVAPTATSPFAETAPVRLTGTR